MNTAIDRHWSAFYTQGKDFTLVSSQTINYFLAYTNTSAPKTCLDIGCGTGQLSRELWHRGYKVVGIDVSEHATEQAQKLTTVPTNQLSYMHFDIEQDNTDMLPFRPYGLITCKLVYAFMRDKPAFLSKVSGLLAAHGSFVVITPLAEYTPPEKRGIAVSHDEVALLSQHFNEIAWYEESGVGYFVGQRL